MSIDEEVREFTQKMWLDDDPLPWMFAKEVYDYWGKNGLLHVSELHGRSHADNVMILVRAISKKLGELKDSDDGSQNNYNKLDTIILACAAMWHDVGRVDDSDDLEHGSKGVAFISDNIKKEYNKKFYEYIDAGLSKILNVMGQPNLYVAIYKQLPKILQCVKVHCDDSMGDGIYEKILKDADKLDRFRIEIQGPPPDSLALDVSRDDMIVFLARLINNRV